MDRRNFFQSSALVSTGALIGCAVPVVAQQQTRTPFAVAQTTIPIVGSDEMFPVRRIYCIGRNYAAHAREMRVIALTGKGGGRMSSQLRDGDIHICVPENRTARIQEVHQMIYHFWCEVLDAQF